VRGQLGIKSRVFLCMSPARERRISRSNVTEQASGCGRRRPSSAVGRIISLSKSPARFNELNERVTPTSLCTEISQA
jgi:hypothetical protein